MGNKKYIVTSKHPELKEGVIITKEDDAIKFKLGGKDFYSGSLICPIWIKAGYIIEVEKTEFTKSDMLTFAQWSWTDSNCSEESFNKWQKQRSND